LSSSTIDPLSSGADGQPGLRGHLHLEAVRREDGRTGVGRQSVRAPFHLGKPYWDGRVLQARIVNATAGILEGDRLEFGVQVRAGAALAVMTPAATRAFMMTGGKAECRQLFAVEAGGWLEYAPEPLFPHRHTDYGQTSRLELAKGAEAYWTDQLAPGRAGRGELWGWRDLRLALEVAVAGEIVLRERLAGPGAELARTAAFFGPGEAWFGTVVACSAALEGDEDFWRRVRAQDGPGRRIGASRLRQGVWVARVVAADSLALRDGMAQLRRLFAEKLPLLGTDLRRL
jgi:urease accessory protein